MSKRYSCGMCGGSGTVSADHTDRRKGERSCSNCGGAGEIGG